MKIHIENHTPIPNVAVIGCEQSFGCEQLEIDFGDEWKKLKKHVTLYFPDDSEPITVEYKRSPILIPKGAYESAGLCRYVIVGESKKKRIVSRTGYLRILRSPEDNDSSEARGTK